eukprot:scaffold24912_cov109-Isochrysis_galbana.AAC.3
MESWKPTCKACTRAARLQHALAPACERRILPSAPRPAPDSKSLLSARSVHQPPASRVKGVENKRCKETKVPPPATTSVSGSETETGGSDSIRAIPQSARAKGSGADGEQRYPVDRAFRSRHLIPSSTTKFPY